jgi:peptidoglycan hydrolase-like protein with peptidoglycan-binding domain
MVYACDGTYVYTIEGNSGNMVRKRSYLLTSSYIYGWIRPNYAAAAKTETVTTKVEQYGAVCCKDPELHVLSKGTAGPEVATIQRIIVAAGIDTTLKIDGEFGPATKTAVMALQRTLGIGQDGAVGKRTWPAALKKLA